MTHPKPNQTIPHPLLTDLLDQALSLPEVARRHDRPLAELAEILQSPRFAAAAAEFADAVARRQAWLRPVVRSEALAAVCRVMGQEITSAARAESVRKAVGMVLRWKESEPEDAPVRPETPETTDPNGPEPGTAAARARVGAHAREEALATRADAPDRALPNGRGAGRGAGLATPPDRTHPSLGASSTGGPRADRPAARLRSAAGQGRSARAGQSGPPGTDHSGVDLELGVLAGVG